jgi:bifunctional N-acetylglucosamine-1-phosphate-uridyltransferase/glucosamine-1-phosphate-acetyltransferase GlmU-like protein
MMAGAGKQEGDYDRGGDKRKYRLDRHGGTSHAVDQARAALADFDGDALILYGDTPFIAPETLAAMTAARH